MPHRSTTGGSSGSFSSRSPRGPSRSSAAGGTPRRLLRPTWSSASIRSTCTCRVGRRPAPARRVRPMRTRRRAANLAFVALFFTGASFSAFAEDNVANLLQDDGSETLAVVEATEVPEGQHVEEFEPEPAPPVEAAPAEPRAARGRTGARGSRSRGGAGRGTGDGGRARRGRGSGPRRTSLVALSHPTARLPTTRFRRRRTRSRTARVTRPRGQTARSTKARALARARAGEAPARRSRGARGERRGDRVAPPRAAGSDPAVAPPRADTASRLHSAAKSTGLDWAYLLAVVRADGAQSSAPARGTTFAETARRLAALRSSSRWDAPSRTRAGRRRPIRPSRSPATTGPSACRRSSTGSRARRRSRRRCSPTTASSSTPAVAPTSRPAGSTSACSRWSSTSPSRTAR